VPIIRELVRTYLTAGQPTVIQLARLLETSPRTLQRRLADEGTSLTAIIDDERRTRALAAVIDSSRTVVDTAMICGYTDPANFTRAFRRWTGMSPLEFRRLSILN
jgi:AraC-like DNA-binding protein